jgi:ubiquinone/menaquinone biosynthesis C-methylase UbiE
MEIFSELHTDLPREGPGCNESTRKAFLQLPSLPNSARLLDIGCGPGIQTIELASLLEGNGGELVATDIIEGYLRDLELNLVDGGMQNATCEVADMFNLNYENNSFDIVWAEGAVFIIGFEKGLSEWKRLLRPNGFVVVSELSWFTEDPPQETRSFWTTAYPNMKTIDENIMVAKSCGFDVVNHFSLPESGWFDDYYGPLESRIGNLQEKYSESQEVVSQLQGCMLEIDMYKEYSEHYGYEFYILQANNNCALAGGTKPQKD